MRPIILLICLTVLGSLSPLSARIDSQWRGPDSPLGRAAVLTRGATRLCVLIFPVGRPADDLGDTAAARLSLRLCRAGGG